MTEPAATESGTLSGLSPVATDSQGVVHRVRRRDPVPLGAGIAVAVVGLSPLVLRSQSDASVYYADYAHGSDDAVGTTPPELSRASARAACSPRASTWAPPQRPRKA